jgi:carboxyl-terminal processing protease
MLVISTEPLRADPILGFVGWGGPFMQNMLGGNRMPKGKTTVYGLPEGKVHVGLFANDNVPGFGTAEATIQPGKTTELYVPLVAGWSDGHHDPPKRLAPLVEELESLIFEEDLSISGVLETHGIRLQPKGLLQSQQQIAQHLEKEIKLPNGRKTTFADFMAAVRYLELQKSVQKRAQRGKLAKQLREIERSFPGGATGGSYREALFGLYQELGKNYPCFELKGIDWKAVGEELLPRVVKVKTDEQFGLLCLELVARLEDSHAQLMPGKAQLPAVEFPRWDPGFACLIDGRGKPVVYAVDKDGPAEGAGVKVGMTVLSVGGEPAQVYLKRRTKEIKKYSGYSSDRYLRYHAAQWLGRQVKQGAKTELEMQDPDGKSHTFKLPATLGVRYLPRRPVQVAGTSDTADVSWTMLEDDIGYIYVRRIRGDLIEKLDQAVGELKDARGVIVDVRGNSGGGFDASRAHRNFAPDDSEEPDRPRFQGPIALLIDARCISAGEGWASWFIAKRRARVFGEATAGASARKTIYTLTNGLFKVRYPVKAYKGSLDRPIERRGLEPDVPVRQSARDLAAGRDTVLEAAKRYLLAAK